MRSPTSTASWRPRSGRPTSTSSIRPASCSDRTPRLDVPGSFHVSTAHELRFADGARFSAVDKTGSGLTVAPPEAFGFLDQPPGRIDGRSKPVAAHARQDAVPGRR